MNDIDDLLNSLGIDSSPVRVDANVTSETPHPADNLPIVPESPQQEEPSNVTFTDSDINDIFAGNGFQEPQYDEAEEVHDGSDDDTDWDGDEDEYDENQGEGRDLDAEEDADWDALEQAESITPVERAIQEIDEHIALQAVQDVDENYPAHNPDEEVSQNAMEAFYLAVQNNLPAPEPLIPLNSPTLLRNDATSRFSGTEWYNEIQKSRIILAGCGGIGSWTILQLARMNPTVLFMYDDDIVETANMSGQLYCQEDIGKAKVNAMADMIRSYTTMRNIYAIEDKFTSQSEAGDIMICGFDNMNARKTFFTVWNNHVMSKPEEDRYKCIYLDGRLSINTLQVFCITGNNDWAMAEYAEKYLFTDDQAEATQCSLKQTTYLACMIGSVIVNLFTNWVANTLNPIIPYDLPFFTEYDAQNMIFKTIK